MTSSPEGSVHSNAPKGDRPLFVVAAQFPNSESQARAYYDSRNILIQSSELELAAHRFRIVRTKILHVAVIGYSSNEDLKHHINRILTRGDLIELPTDIIDLLSHRLRPIPSASSWIEGTQRSLVQPKRQ